MIFFLFLLKNIDCGYMLEPPLCFEAKIRKNVYPCKPQFYYIKVGCKGVFVAWTCFRDDMYVLSRKIEKNITIIHLKIVIFTATKSQYIA